MSDETQTAPVEGAEQTDSPQLSEQQEMEAIFDKANAADAAQPDKAAEPARGPDGKFIARDAAPETAAAPKEIPDQGATQETESAQPSLEPPASWSDAEKAVWGGLTPEAQQAIIRRETEAQKAIEERALRLKDFEPIAAAIEPMRQHLALSGISDAQYVSQLIAADQLLRQRPQEALRWIAQRYGVDPGQINQQPDQEIDPALAPLIQEINSLKSTVTGFQTAQQQQELAHTVSLVERFKADPANKHYASVETDMMTLIPGIRQMNPGMPPDQVLRSAYDRAVWANETVRAQLLAEQSAEAERKRKEDAAKKAEQARRVSQGNLSSRGTASGTTPAKRTDEEMMAEVFDRMSGAA